MEKSLEISFSKSRSKKVPVKRVNIGAHEIIGPATDRTKQELLDVAHEILGKTRKAKKSGYRGYYRPIPPMQGVNHYEANRRKKGEPKPKHLMAEVTPLNQQDALYRLESGQGLGVRIRREIFTDNGIESTVYELKQAPDGDGGLTITYSGDHDDCTVPSDKEVAQTLLRPLEDCLENGGYIPGEHYTYNQVKALVGDLAGQGHIEVPFV